MVPSSWIAAISPTSSAPVGGASSVRSGAGSPATQWFHSPSSTLRLSAPTPPGCLLTPNPSGAICDDSSRPATPGSEQGFCAPVDVGEGDAVGVGVGVGVVPPLPPPHACCPGSAIA